MIKTVPWDPAEHIESPEDVAAYLEAAFEDGDPAVIKIMLGAIARSKGMTAIARDTGITGDALDGNGDPRLSTRLGVMKALGLTLTVKAARREGRTGPGAPSPRPFQPS